MNNEILFTAKLANNNSWVVGPSVGIFPDGYSVIGVYEKPQHGIGSIVWKEINQDTLCRYSGQKDINNKEIFENFLIQFEYEDDCLPAGKGKCIGVVVFENGCFVVKEPGSNYECEKPLTLAEWLEDECTIVGNIFDNQELWKK